MMKCICDFCKKNEASISVKTHSYVFIIPDKTRDICNECHNKLFGRDIVNVPPERKA